MADGGWRMPDARCPMPDESLSAAPTRDQFPLLSSSFASFLSSSFVPFLPPVSPATRPCRLPA